MFFSSFILKYKLGVVKGLYILKIEVEVGKYICMKIRFEIDLEFFIFVNGMCSRKGIGFGSWYICSC